MDVSDLNESLKTSLANRSAPSVVDVGTELHPVNRFERFKLPVAGLAIHPLGIADVIEMLQRIIRNDFVTNQSPPLQAGTEFTLAPGDFRDGSRGLQFPLKLRTEQSTAVQ